MWRNMRYGVRTKMNLIACHFRKSAYNAILLDDHNPIIKTFLFLRQLA